MLKTKPRNLFYQRVHWLDGKVQNLENYLVQAHNSLTATKDMNL